MFLTPAEIQLMNHDFESNLLAPEAASITVAYRTLLFPVQPVDIDPVYNTDLRQQDSVVVEVPDIRCLIQIIKPRDLKEMNDRILEVGDAIFWFSKTLNLTELVTGKPVVPHSIRFQETISTLVWIPVLEDPGVVERSLLCRVDMIQIAQPVAAKLEK